MLENITIDKIRQLKLFGMIDGIEHIKQSQALQTLTFAEGLAMLVDRETLYRDNKRLSRLLKNAKLRYPQATVEDINYKHKRAISPDKFKWLSTGKWLIENQNIIFLGPTGLGKTYLACACAQLACRMGFKARYFRLSKLLEALRIGKADGSYTKLITQLIKEQCLVIDDWGIEPILPEQRSQLLEIIDDNYENRSVIIATQLPIGHWHEYLGDHTIADAILDRIVHQAKFFEFEGPTMRGHIESS